MAAVAEIEDAKIEVTKIEGTKIELTGVELSAMTLTRQTKRRLCYWLAFALILVAPLQTVSADFLQSMSSDHCSHAADTTGVAEIPASDSMSCCQSHNGCGGDCLNLCGGMIFSIAIPSYSAVLPRIVESPQFQYAAIEKSIVSTPQLPPPIRL